MKFSIMQGTSANSGKQCTKKRKKPVSNKESIDKGELSREHGCPQDTLLPHKNI